MKYKGSYLAYFLMNTFYFLALALFSVIISIYLMGLGYNAREVSLVVTAQYILSMITQPIIGDLCDRYNKKKVAAVILIFSAVIGLFFMAARNLIAIMILYALGLSLINGLNPMIERASVLSSHKYAGIRIWSTIGYALGSQLSGIIYRYISPQAIYLFFGIAIIFCIVGIMGTKDRVTTINKPDVETNEKKWVHGDFICYLAITIIFYATTNINSTYLPSFYQSLGLSVNQSASVISLCTLSELPVIIFGSRLINRLSNKTLLLFDMTLITVQFTIYGFCRIIPLLVVTTILTKAVATMSFIMINQKIIATIIDDAHQMRALSLVATMKSLSTIVFQLISGYLIDTLSYPFFYLTLSLLSLAGMILVVFYKLPDGHGVRLFQ